MTSPTNPLALEEQRDEQDILQSFHKKLKLCWCSTRYDGLECPDQYFLDLEKFESFMGKQVVGQLLKAVLPQEELFDLDRTVRKVKLQYLRLFAMLLKIKAGRYIFIFIGNSDFEDSKLPIACDDEPPGFPSGIPDIWKEFKKEQYHFFPIKFSGLDTRQMWSQEKILPFKTVDARGGGGNGRIKKIEVLGSYNGVHREGSNPLNDSLRNVFALKTYRLMDLQHFKNEVRAFRALVDDSGNVPEGLVKIHGAFDHGDQHNIVMEWADRGNLSQFLERNQPPITISDVKDFWKRILNLISGLQAICEINRWESPYEGVHGDIKPDNILVFADGLQSLFKISDLGTAHFDEWTAEDMPHRVDPGTVEFGAPEISGRERAQSGKRFVPAKADVWSLGCVLIVVAVWLYHNWDGVKKFEDERGGATEGRGAFHDGQEVLEVVQETIRDIKAEASERGDKCTERVMEMIKKCLRESSVRLSAAQMKFEAEAAVELSSTESKEPMAESSKGPVRPNSLVHSNGLSNAPKKPPKFWSGQNVDYWSVKEGLEWRKKCNRGQKGEIPFSHLMDDWLQARDHIFLVDRAASMGCHWIEVQELVSLLGKLVKHVDDDGMELYVAPDHRGRTKHRHSTPMKKRLAKIGVNNQASRRTNMESALREILDTACERIRKKKASAKKISVYVLTNGKWDSGSTGVDPIRRAVKTIMDSNVSNETIGIQFIQFGNDDQTATARLEHLDHGLNLELDIVDREWSDGNVWKMLLGALNKRFDNQGEGKEARPVLLDTPRLSTAQGIR